MRIHCVALTLLLTTTSTTAFALTPHTAWIHQKRISFTANFQDSRRNIDSVEDAARVCQSMKLHNNMANSADDDADDAAEGRAVAVREQMLARRLQLGAAAAAENCTAPLAMKLGLQALSRCTWPSLLGPTPLQT